MVNISINLSLHFKSQEESHQPILKPEQGSWWANVWYSFKSQTLQSQVCEGCNLGSWFTQETVARQSLIQPAVTCHSLYTEEQFILRILNAALRTGTTAQIGYEEQFCNYMRCSTLRIMYMRASLSSICSFMKILYNYCYNNSQI